jgi:hypothetical protein
MSLPILPGTPDKPPPSFHRGMIRLDGERGAITQWRV